MKSSIGATRSDAPYDFLTTRSPEDDVSVKIRSFGNLPLGWDVGEGEPAKPEVVIEALQLHALGLSLGFITDAFPDTGGEISITFYHDQDTIEITVNADLTYTLAHERGIGFEFDELTYKENVDYTTLFEYLQGLRVYQQKWKSYESLIQPNTITVENDSRIFPSETTTPGFPLSMPNAYAA